ncbi:MAG: twin-arginine translocation signal domain-containing protein [Fimbriimonadia bacterium]|jgi:anaerobic selenocysteine-containing dehydrogenase
MKHPVSRREFLAVSAALGVAGALPSQAQQTSEPEVDAVVSQLSTDLSDEHKSLLAEAVKGNAEAVRARRRYALPENSEPCFVFRPTGVGGHE